VNVSVKWLFDALFCHDDDEPQLDRLLSGDAGLDGDGNGRGLALGTQDRQVIVLEGLNASDDHWRNARNGRNSTMVDHTVTAFDAELENLRGRVRELGARAREMLSDAAAALANLDAGKAQSVILADTRLNALQRSLEESAIYTIAKRQPVADDLREVIGAVRISTDLERVGDLAKSIARRATKILDAPNCLRGGAGLKPMYKHAADQLKDALDAYAKQDVALAKTIWERDRTLDELEDLSYRNLLTFMMEDAENVPFCVELLFCAKSLERIGDRAKNIAETVVYVVTGEPEVYE
jgi:phosphate transport system protein